jgi:hypothetical protein
MSCTTWIPGHDDGPEALRREADQQRYRATANDRNRVQPRGQPVREVAV